MSKFIPRALQSSRLVKSLAACALTLSMSPMAHATLVGTIYGMYDTPGISALPGSVVNNPNNLNQYNNSLVYDTPTLFFVSPTGFSISNAQMVLSVSAGQNSGQATLNDGVSQTVSLGTINPNSITQVNWGSGGPLFTYDYDDSKDGWIYGGPISGQYNTLAGNSGSFAANCDLNIAHPEWTRFCAPVGNFLVQFSGTLMDGSNGGAGQSIAAVFSEYDINGFYTGWQGLDRMGWSESVAADVHTGTVSGVLANIYLGTVGTVPPSPDAPPLGVPEPSSIALLGIALFGLTTVRRAKSKS